MTKEVIVESFELDHTAVKAPYVRLIGEETGPKGDIISNFDIRLVQPNENAIPTAGLHTIEHLLAMLIRKRIDGMIDCSPFGCRTGFHMIVWRPAVGIAFSLGCTKRISKLEMMSPFGPVSSPIKRT